MNPSLVKRALAAWGAFCARPPDQSGWEANRNLEHYRAMLFRPPSHVRLCELGMVDPAPVDDESLVKRIIAAYQAAQSLDPDQGSFWSDHFSGRKAMIHAALVKGDPGEVSTLLRNPVSNDLFYGFDGLCIGFGKFSDLDRLITQEQLYDLMARLAEALGAVRLDYPENIAAHESQLPTIDEIAGTIEGSLGTPIRFPNPYPGEIGLTSSRGTITFRVPHAVYQARLLTGRKTKDVASRIVEVGAGLGRTAFYAHQLGAQDYTIVDLAMTNVAQAYFLGRTLGTDAISLLGEPQTNAIKIMPPAIFFAGGDEFDVALNADSFPEMSYDTAAHYISVLSDRCRRMISINHEHNAFTTHEIFATRQEWIVERHPYWMRKGYVEEAVYFRRSMEPTS